MYMVAVATWDGKVVVWAVHYNEAQGQNNELTNDNKNG